MALPVSLVLLLGTAGTGPAESNPQTRTLSIVNMHTKDRIAVTYKVNGRYDPAALKKLNYVLRDWRRNEVIAMDPKLFDLLWEVQREAGTNQPIHAVSGFRSPVTNAALRKRGRGVAKHSQHTLGKATDFYIPGVPVSRLREIAFRKQVGGVGYYPTSNTPFVHLDTGNVRSWPRMTRKQLLALFPDGKTLHVPDDGKPLPGYNQALALAKAGQLGSGGASAPAQAKRGRNLLAALFDREDDEEETNAAAGREAPQSAPPPAIVIARASAPAQVQPQAAVAPAAQQTAAAPVAIPPARLPFAIASPAQIAAPQAVEIAAAVPLPPLPAARPAAPKDVTEPLGAGAPALVAVALPTPRPHMDELPVVVAYAGDASATALGASLIDEVLRPGQGPAAMNARLVQARAPSNPYVADLPKPPAGVRFSLMAGWSVAANLGTQHFVHPDQRIQPELLGAPSMLVANSFKPGYTVVGVAYAFSGAAIEPVAVHRFTQPDASATRVAGVR